MTVKPFRAIRPEARFASEFHVPPYDVVDREEVKRHLAAHPRSFFRVTRPDAEMPGVDEHDESVYRRAKENLDSYLADGTLLREKRPTYYLLSQTWKGRTQTGIYAAVSCEEYVQNRIRKHELTRKDKEDDRTKHIMTTGAGTGPVFLAFEKTSDWDALVAPTLRKEPDYHVSDENGTDNKLWVIGSDDVVQAIESYFQTIPALYIADGHHRAASAGNIYRRLSAERPNAPSDAGWKSFMAVIFPSSDLAILAYNRVVFDLNGLDAAAFLKKSEEKFSVAPVDSLEPMAQGDLRAYLGGKCYRLVAKSGTFDSKSALASLDVSVLQENLLKPVLGIDDPRTSKRIQFVGGIKGTAELKRRVDSGEAAVAFSLYPVSMRELMAVVDQGAIMPPKSTWFEPKLRDGLVIYELGL
jgi:uncharacterized protein (DUF1015 family)